MCNILGKSKRKIADVYKVVFKYENNYYGIYSAIKIQIGDVISENILDDNICCAIGNNSIFTIDKSKTTPYYGKISGFLRLKDAKKIIEYNYPNTAIIKMKVSGNLFNGDGKGIGNGFTGEEKTLFATKVISYSTTYIIV